MQFAGRRHEAFGSTDALIEKLKAEAVGHFGSGWAALNLHNGKLEVTSYHDADTPVAYEGVQPLFILDVWEHAYYLKYQNKRADYIENWWKVVNWDYVQERYEKMK